MMLRSLVPYDAPFLTARLTAPGSPRMQVSMLLAFFCLDSYAD